MIKCLCSSCEGNLGSHELHVYSHCVIETCLKFRGLVNYHYGGKTGSRQAQQGALAKSLHPGQEFQGK